MSAFKSHLLMSDTGYKLLPGGQCGKMATRRSIVEVVDLD